MTRSQPGPSRAAPPAARVEDNRWAELDPPAAGSWTPSARVTVVIPVYNPGAALQRTLAALAAQTYPPELLEVVVVDDGSDEPVEVPAAEGLAVSVVRQERDGFGAGRARNLGAAKAGGDILHFLDADMVCEPWTVETHARWHHLVADAVVLGERCHADFDDVDPAALAGVGPDGLASLLEGKQTEGPAWLEDFLRRTDRLTARRSDLFAAATASNLSMRADTFAAVGGFTPFGLRGIEDTELGYRLFADGALLVADPDTVAWHQGRTHFQGDTTATKRRRLPKLLHHVPAPNIRAPGTGRRLAVPRLLAHVDATAASSEAALACVDRLLAADLRDLAVLVDPPGEALDATLLREHLAADDRVHWEGEPVGWPWLQAWVPVSAAVDPGALDDLCARLDKGRLGAVHVTIPGIAPAQARVVAATTRALARARRVTGEPDGTPVGGAVREVVAELFGEEWLDGSTVGVRDAGREPADGEVPGPAAPRTLRLIEGAQRSEDKARRAAQQAEQRAERAERRAGTAEQRLAAAEEQLQRLEAQVTSLRNRKVLRAVDRAGGMLRWVKGRR